LRIARDALLIDSTHLTVAGVVDEIIRHLEAKGLSIPSR
jgi:cytidylate kinase